MNSMIWCEVVCNYCGGLAINSGWYSPEIIKKIKMETKDWTRTSDGQIICPECISKYEL